ncbi:hypothetical protein [Kitasatospora purpeofusca]|uniref:hypothetical protein n=1 Tax=Kitasatospora purpeofusca TaxID=67352 RepID=UPI00386DBB9D|nr:hypothetical protein OIP63_05960 [Kitasatospora purpeofusca]
MIAWEADAELFGKASSKAFLALLAARCVELSESGVSVHLDTYKVSALQFSRASGKGTNTVKRYLAAWDLLAEDGHVPPRAELVPGMDVELPSAKTWTEYYRRANPPKPKNPGDVTLEQAEAEIAEDSAARLVPTPKGRHVDTFLLRMFDATSDIESRLPRSAADAVGRLVDALADLTEPDQTNRAFLRSLDAVVELAAALGTP